MYTQTEKVNIEPKSYLPVFRVSQNDVGRTLKAHLISDEGTITIPQGATVTMAGIKPSGLGYTVTGTIVGSDVSFETDATMTDEAGQIQSEIRIVVGETLIGTTNVILNVEPNPHPSDTTDGQREPLVNEITALLNQITAQAERVEEYSSKVLNMTVSAHESEAPTVTKTEGEVVNLDFGLPRGAKGEQGERGERGERGEAGQDGKDGINGKDGKDGINGVTPDFSIGTVTTLEPNESASVTLTGTEEEPVLNFGIPKGDQGEVSLNDLKKIMVTDSASGSIASFPDGSDLLPAISLVANIVPKQSGTGTPSPENVRPISGWTEVETVVSGVNVWDEEWENGWIHTGGSNRDGDNLIRSTNYIPVAPNTDYYFNVPDSTDIIYFDINKNSLGNYDKNGLGDTSPTSKIRCTQENCHYIRFWTRNQTTYNHDISINYPSTDHDYHAYSGHTHTTSLGRTVYGGTVDLASGVLNAYPYYASYNGETLNGEWVCDRAVYAQGTTPPIGSQVALISGESTTYTLTPQTINTLLGVNNVWADSGDCEITYYADTKLYIDKKLGGS